MSSAVSAEVHQPGSGGLTPPPPFAAMPETPGTEVALGDPLAQSLGGSSINSRLTSPRPLSQTFARRIEAGNARPGSAGTARGGVLVPRPNEAMMSATRRQIEAVEDKLNTMISKAQNHSERLHNAAFSCVNQKMQNMEALQPKFDRRLAELSGNYKGLSDEMQAQIKRVDQLDTKIWDFRHQLEEEIRKKVLEMEQKQNEAASQLRVLMAAVDSDQKRYEQRTSKLEKLVYERVPAHEDLMSQFESRLQEVEATRTQIPDVALLRAEPPALPIADSSPVSETDFLLLQRRFDDMSAKMEAFQKANHDFHQKYEEQEERIKSLRTRTEDEGTQLRSLSERLQSIDSEARLKEVQNQLMDLGQGRTEHAENLELLNKKLESHMEETNGIRDTVRKLHMSAPVEEVVHEASAEIESPALTQALDDIQDCQRRLNDYDGRIGSLEGYYNSVRQDIELAPRVGELVEQLKQVAPKVMDQELAVRSLHEKVGKLEVGGRLGGDRTSHEAALSRIEKLEEQVHRLNPSSAVTS